MLLTLETLTSELTWWKQESDWELFSLSSSISRERGLHVLNCFVQGGPGKKNLIGAWGRWKRTPTTRKGQRIMSLTGYGWGRSGCRGIASIRPGKYRHRRMNLTWYGWGRPGCLRFTRVALSRSWRKCSERTRLRESGQGRMLVQRSLGLKSAQMRENCFGQMQEKQLKKNSTGVCWLLAQETRTQVTVC